MGISKIYHITRPPTSVFVTIHRFLIISYHKVGEFMDWFINLNVIMQAFLAASFTFLITALGSAIVFCFKKVNKNLSDILLGVSAGIMLAASYFSLLAPAIDQAINMAFLPYIIAIFKFPIKSLLIFFPPRPFYIV